jgi:Zn-dependent peptidase ImmA (M78 family)
MARKILAARKVSRPPIDVHSIARDEGIQIQEIRNQSVGWSGKFYRTNKLIALNGEHHPNRQRFTLAHELGHHFLGHDAEEFMDGLDAFGGYETGELADDVAVIDFEREANEFASELLIPLSLIKSDYRTERDAKALATQYEVSEAAMWVSLIKHGLFK